MSRLDYITRIICLLSVMAFLFACSGAPDITGQIDRKPDIFPDYKAVTIPYNIAPLNFSLEGASGKAFVRLVYEGHSLEVKSSDGRFILPPGKWKTLLLASKGKSIDITVSVKEGKDWKSYTPFQIDVAEEPVDSHIAYRLIEPGYELWNEMGIYQRNLETYTQSTVYENKMTGYNCVNCHSFCMQDPDKMLFHMRAAHAGTIFVDGDNIERLDTKTDKTISSLTYPSWHPSGKFVAFSINQTLQEYHPTQRVEVFDKASDVVVYDIEQKKILAIPASYSPTRFETFPTFSPDGQTLYFCSAPSCPMPDSVSQLKYSLCSISFDPVNRTFGSQTDTLYNAELNGKSVSFPRISPDGKFLLCTLSGYGTFPIWHRDADLYMINLQTGEGYYTEQANSNETDSYHSWSSNSRWVVFSSRRLDGLYTRPFLTYIDSTGNASKAFVLPQKETSHYQTFMKSYNIPEFVTGKIKDRSYSIMQKAKHSTPTPISFEIVGK